MVYFGNYPSVKQNFYFKLFVQIYYGDLYYPTIMIINAFNHQFPLYVFHPLCYSTNPHIPIKDQYIFSSQKRSLTWAGNFLLEASLACQELKLFFLINILNYYFYYYYYSKYYCFNYSNSNWITWQIILSTWHHYIQLC
jgi:hypothetical protein